MIVHSVEFYFDVGSPTSYLAYTQLPRIAADAGVPLRYRPMLLDGVFEATGNASPISVPAKGRWMRDDLARWAARHGVPFSFNPNFPIDTLTLMRGAIGMQMRRPEALERYLDAVFAAMWVQPRDLGDADTLADVLREARLDPREFGALVADDAVKARLLAETEAAVARGVFGAPTVFVGDAMFFGQDRMEFVRTALGD